MLKKRDLEYYLNKNINLILKNKIFYTGLLLDLDEEHLKIRDKYDSIVLVLLNEIISIREVKEKEW